ncbi:MAG: outer membrane lipoprotein-sorting protein [Planctomycetota bacterium]|jgi:outer membrane lipoprotein-sorting protein
MILLLGAAFAFALPAGSAFGQEQPPKESAGEAKDKKPSGKGKFGKGLPKSGRLGKSLTGLAIMRLRETQTLGRTEIADLDVKTEGKGRITRMQRILRYVQREDGLEKKLVRIIAPASSRHFGALTIEVESGQDLQWIYLPEARRIKRLATSEVTESFADTGFAIEDLRSEDLDSHRYKTLGIKDVQGRKAYEIEATPIPGRTRALKGYSKRTIYVDTERWVELQIDFYDPGGKLLKRQQNLRWKAVGEIFRPYRIKMTEFQNGRTTWLRFRSWEANIEFPDDMFTTRELAREHE